MKPLRSKAKLASAMSRVRRRRPGVEASQAGTPASAVSNEVPGRPDPAARPDATPYSLIGW